VAGSFRLAVDIGGTFTDVVLERGGVRTATKVLTTYDDPAGGVMAGLERVCAEAGAVPRDARLLLHGTTLATNALIERRGARTALLTTEGHRDALEMALENRFEQYDLDIDRPVPLVPRPLRLPVTERLDAGGRVLKPLDLSSVDQAVRVMEANGVTSIAVGLLHAYANPEHELRVAEHLAARLPDAALSLSSAVCPEIREYERLSTTCANAYVKPLMARYLASLETRLKDAGFRCPILLMTSGGGLTSLAAAREYPIRLVESGPAGGAILAADLCTALDIRSALSFDMGGTTAKLCVVDNGEPLHSRSFEVDRSYRFKKGSGLPVRIPVIEMVEIGAGGGSIASVDPLGRVQVGPESAGSEPGPACYGRGGEAPTVTDADLMLGKLDPETFAGGRLALDVEAARRAFADHLAAALGADPVVSAHAVSEVVNENMAAAARAHLAEWGKSTAGRQLIAFGGAAPLHACLLAHKLKLDSVVVPANAGVGSAVGFLLAPVSYEVVRSRYARLDELEPREVEALMAGMRAEALQVVAEAADPQTLEETRKAFMRYVGQGYEIAVPVSADSQLDPTALRDVFESEYRRLYGRTIPGLQVEVLSWTLALGERERDDVQHDGWTLERERAAGAHRDVFDVVLGTRVRAGCYERARLEPGDYLRGPALVAEEQTTTFVASGYQAVVSRRRHLILMREEI